MPPRLITGITLLFWGGMTGHSLLGLIAALLVEARSWVNIRWKFSQKTYIRSWHYSILCGALIGILAWINGKKVGELHTLFVWVPLVLLPIELAMRYGTAEKIPLNTFSFFARKKREYDLKYGRLHLTHPRMIHTGWLYIAATLLASAMSSRNEQLHFIGLTAIVTVALIANGKKTAFRPIAWTFSLMLVFALSFAGQRGLSRLYDFYRGGNPDASPYHNISANETRTSIGRLGRLKLSPHIFWRMQVNKGAPPRLLRIATYNQYARANWKYNTKNPITQPASETTTATSRPPISLTTTSESSKKRILTPPNLSPPSRKHPTSASSGKSTPEYSKTPFPSPASPKVLATSEI
jgi:hypothetical protein